jgi:hypothetical protein
VVKILSFPANIIIKIKHFLELSKRIMQNKILSVVQFLPEQWIAIQVIKISAASMKRKYSCACLLKTKSLLLGLYFEPNPVHTTPYLSKLLHSMEQNPS